MSVDAGNAHSACVYRDVMASRVVSDSGDLCHRCTSAAQHVRQTAAEIVGQQRVQERVEAAVEVVEDERERRNELVPVGELKLTEGLPQHTDVVWQDADSERDDDSDQQTNDFASSAECGLVSGGGQCAGLATCFTTAGQ